MPLRISLNLPPGDNQVAFATNLNAALKEALTAFQSSAAFQADGTFSTWVSGPATIGGAEYPLTFALRYGANGVLEHVDVEALEAETVDWRAMASALVTGSLANTLSERRIKYFNRHQLSYVGGAIDGEYWVSGFRLGPALPDDPDAFLMNAERVPFLDFQVEAVDMHHAQSISKEFAQRQSARLSLLLGFPLVTPDRTMRWVRPPATPEDPVPDSIRLETVFGRKDFPPLRMPEKGTLCRAGKFEGALSDRFRNTAGHLLTMPRETRRVFRALNLSPSFREALDAYARLYHLGLLVSRSSRTAGLAYRVAGIDAICQVYKAWKGPSAFMRNFAPSFPNIDALVDFLYSDVRSAHFHAGQATLDQDHMIPFHPLMTAEYVKQMELLDQGYWLTRLSFANWVAQELLSILGPSEEQP